MRNGLAEYIEKHILPAYESFSDGHDRKHIETVIRESLYLASVHGADEDMAYAIAAYHDIGIPNGRKTHHITSAAALYADEELKKWFSPEQLVILKEAVEDHRASAEEKPRSIYGCIIADADHFVIPEDVIRRTVQFGLANYPGLTKEEHILRARAHMREKYLAGGYLHFHLNDPRSLAGLERLRALAEDDARFGCECRRWL